MYEGEHNQVNPSPSPSPSPNPSPNLYPKPSPSPSPSPSSNPSPNPNPNPNPNPTPTPNQTLPGLEAVNTSRRTLHLPAGLLQPAATYVFAFTAFVIDAAAKGRSEPELASTAYATKR